MEKETYQISVIGCDDKTVFNIGLDEIGLKLVIDISNKCNDTSQSDCQPKISIERTKVYRCGWCGQPCDKEGNPVIWTEDISEGCEVDLVGGDCCAYEQMNGDPREKHQVTRDMATDAGDRSLEGQWI